MSRAVADRTSAADGGGLVIYYPVMAQRVVPARTAA
jgi:hypothetical protein